MIESTISGAALTNSPPIRLVMVGLGNQGREHLEGSRSCTDVEFVAGIDPNQQVREQVQACFPKLSCHASWQEFIEKRIPFDALVLALPHHVYQSEWTAISECGRPILKEKPLARNLAEAREFHRLAPRTRTAIQRRHHGSYRAAAEFIRSRKLVINELYAHLHLGRSATESWRADPRTSGGGILLDAGYHLIDLVHFFIGGFDAVTCELWIDERRARESEIEDRAFLIGRSDLSWVLIDARRGGELNADGGAPLKSEGIRIETGEGILFANRAMLTWNDEVISTHDSDWSHAMADQLSRFADDIRADRWSDDVYWDQLPAMRLIDEAYRLATRF